MKNEIKNLTKWIKEYVDNSGAKGVVIGLSGGIDSCVVASLAVKALGKENVYGALIPCYSSNNDVDDASEFAQFLGIKYNVYNLNETFDVLADVISSKQDMYIMTSANIKARLRMITLYAIASELKYLVIGTGNKTEHEIGYFTKYGDGGTDFEPIFNFYKTEVWELAKELNVPQKFIDRVPTAGLWINQTDENEIGCSYKELDLYLQENKVEFLSKEQEDRIEKLKRNAKHKQNMPPVYNRNGYKAVEIIASEMISN